MKKIVSLFIFLLLLVGCSLSNSPTSKVEELLNKYQTLDSDIKSGIDDVLKEENLNTSQKERYRKNIHKRIKIVLLIVIVVFIIIIAKVFYIEVIDYKKQVNDTNNYYQGKTDYTVEDYNNTKLDKLEKAKDKVKYTIDFEVKKDSNGNWKLSSLSNETIKKIQGMY